MIRPSDRARYVAGILYLAWAALTNSASATPDLRFDVVTFCCNCSGQVLCTNQFNDLNFSTTNGHYLAMGTDTHRLELATNGNALAIYYNTLNDNYPNYTGAQQAASINTNSLNNFTSNGPRPDWIFLNEISSGLWQSDSTYRGWVRDVAHALKNTYGYNVVMYAPFANPGNNSADWQALQADAYIGVENYLSGEEILAQGFSVSWCQSQYQSSINSYGSVGVPASRLILTELFSQSLSGSGYGRTQVSSNDWDSAIIARSIAAHNCVFAGYSSYNWGGNPAGAPTNEMVHFEDTYAAQPLPKTNVLTAPSVVLQPQSQTSPAGGNVSLLVFKGGTAPTTYQWRFMGTNLPGATGMSLPLTNVQITNAGNYCVVLSNAVGTCTSADAFLTVAVPPAISFDPFAPAVTTYAPGANLVGQTNADGGYWTQAGPTGTQPTIQAGNLSVGGLAGPSGNSVKFGGNGMSARFNPGTNSSSGTWFYSLIVRLTDISTLNSSGVFWAGFNNSAGTQTTTPTSVGTRVLTRSATGGYNIGLDKNSGIVSSLVFSPTVFTTSDTVFLVGSYTFNSGTTTDDVSQLWINPPASAFGQANPPPATLTNTSGTDLSGIASFVLFNRNANEPAAILADEVRFGASWASVTPPALVPTPPALSISQFGSNDVLSWPTNSPGFLLQSATTLSTPGSWNGVVGPVYISGDQYVVTNSITGGASFYRLQKP